MLPLVDIISVSKAYYTVKEETIAIKDFSLSIYPRDFIALVGPSGCGKSTVLSILAGLTEPTAGKVKFFTDEPAIGYMLQQDHLFPWLTVSQNATLGLTVKKAVNKESLDYADYLLEKYGLKDFSKLYPHQLSGGMRQRTALIRTLVIRPDILLLDEPFSALDYQTRLEVSEDIASIIKAEDITAVLVTHDLSEAIALSDRVAVMSARPAVLKSVHDITFPEQSDNIALRRRSELFNEYYAAIFKELKNS